MGCLRCCCVVCHLYCLITFLLSTSVHVYPIIIISAPVHVGLVLTTLNVQEDEIFLPICATVFSPPILERDIQVVVNTRDYTAG